MQKILVTGGNGQLGNELQQLAKIETGFEFIFTDYQELDITNKEQVAKFFEVEKPDFVINCAAYTAVDRAEEDREKCYQINVTGAENLAKNCAKNDSVLIQISTDFVYDGKKSRPYKEFDPAAPLSYYGETKLQGEEVCKVNPKTVIIRTSWLYSTFGVNFVKTMLKLGNERDVLNIVSDQTGTPTYAEDLAVAIMQIIKQDLTDKYRIYHYSNEGSATWYDFTKAIFDITQVDCQVNPIDTEDYPTAATRPAYSVMNKNKIKSQFKLKIPYWRDSLAKMLTKLNNEK